MAAAAAAAASQAAVALPGSGALTLSMGHEADDNSEYDVLDQAKMNDFFEHLETIKTSLSEIPKEVVVDETVHELLSRSSEKRRELASSEIVVGIVGPPGGGKTSLLNSSISETHDSPFYTAPGSSHATIALQRAVRSPHFELAFQRLPLDTCRALLTAIASSPENEQHVPVAQKVAAQKQLQQLDSGELQLPEKLSVAEALDLFCSSDEDSKRIRDQLDKAAIDSDGDVTMGDGGAPSSSEPAAEQKALVQMVSKAVASMDALVGCYVLSLRAPWLKLAEKTVLMDSPGWADMSALDVLVKYVCDVAHVLACTTSNRVVDGKVIADLINRGVATQRKLDAPPVLIIHDRPLESEFAQPNYMQRSKDHALSLIDKAELSADVLRSFRREGRAKCGDVFRRLRGSLMMSATVFSKDGRVVRTEGRIGNPEIAQKLRYFVQSQVFQLVLHGHCAFLYQVRSTLKVLCHHAGDKGSAQYANEMWSEERLKSFVRQDKLKFENMLSMRRQAACGDFAERFLILLKDNLMDQLVGLELQSITKEGLATNIGNMEEVALEAFRTEWYKLRDELIPLRAESLAGLLKNEKWNMDVETTQVLAETLEKRGMAIFKTIPQQAFQELDSRAAALIKEEIEEVQQMVAVPEGGFHDEKSLEKHISSLADALVQRLTTAKRETRSKKSVEGMWLDFFEKELINKLNDSLESSILRPLVIMPSTAHAKKLNEVLKIADETVELYNSNVKKHGPMLAKSTKDVFAIPCKKPTRMPNVSAADAPGNMELSTDEDRRRLQVDFVNDEEEEGTSVGPNPAAMVEDQTSTPTEASTQPIGMSPRVIRVVDVSEDKDSNEVVVKCQARASIHEELRKYSQKRARLLEEARKIGSIDRAGIDPIITSAVPQSGNNLALQSSFNFLFRGVDEENLDYAVFIVVHESEREILEKIVSEPAPGGLVFLVVVDNPAETAGADVVRAEWVVDLQKLVGEWLWREYGLRLSFRTTPRLSGFKEATALLQLHQCTSGRVFMGLRELVVHELDEQLKAGMMEFMKKQKDRDWRRSLRATEGEDADDFIDDLSELPPADDPRAVYQFLQERICGWPASVQTVIEPMLQTYLTCGSVTVAAFTRQILLADRSAVHENLAKELRCNYELKYQNKRCTSYGMTFLVLNVADTQEGVYTCARTLFLQKPGTSRAKYYEEEYLDAEGQLARSLMSQPGANCLKTDLYCITYSPKERTRAPSSPGKGKKATTPWHTLSKRSSAGRNSASSTGPPPGKTPYVYDRTAEKILQRLSPSTAALPDISSDRAVTITELTNMARRQSRELGQDDGALRVLLAIAIENDMSVATEAALREAVSDFACKSSDGFAAMGLPAAVKLSDLQASFFRLRGDKQLVGLDFLLAFAIWCNVGIFLRYIKPDQKRWSEIALNYNARARPSVWLALIPAAHAPKVRLARIVGETDEESDDGLMSTDGDGGEDGGKTLAAAAPSREQVSRKRAAPDDDDDNPGKHMRRT